MELPPALVSKLVELGSTTAFRIFEGYVSNLSIKHPEPESEPDTGCHTCEIHQHIVLAAGYMEGLYTRLNADKSIPAGLGGTIPLATSHLRDAMLEFPEVVGAHPAIDSACKQLSDIIPPLMARMENIKSDEDWTYILNKMSLAKDAAYSIPEAMYRREPNHTPEQEQIVVILSPDEKKMLDILKESREGVITKDEAKKQLSELTGV